MATVAGDAPFLTSKPFLQRMGAVLDLEKGEVAVKKLGVTIDLGESETGQYVINLIPDCVDPISDGMALEKCAWFCEAPSWNYCKRLWNPGRKQGVLEPDQRFRESNNH